MDGADETLFLAVVAQRLPRRLDARGDRGLGDDPAAPDLLDDLVLADEAVGIAREQDQQRQHLRLQMLRVPVLAQLELARIELEAFKAVDQGGAERQASNSP